MLLLEETEADVIQAEALNVAEGTRIFHSLMVHFEMMSRYKLKIAASMPRWCQTIYYRITPPPRRMIICR